MASLSRSSAERTAFSASMSLRRNAPDRLAARVLRNSLCLRQVTPRTARLRDSHSTAARIASTGEWITSSARDFQPELGDELPAQPHRNRVLADLLDGLPEGDLAAVDFKPLLGQQLGDVGRRHGAEELALLAGLGDHLELQGLEPVAQRLEILQLLRELLRHHPLVVLELARSSTRWRESPFPAGAGSSARTPP